MKMRYELAAILAAAWVFSPSASNAVSVGQPLAVIDTATISIVNDFGPATTAGPYDISVVGAPVFTGAFGWPGIVGEALSFFAGAIVAPDFDLVSGTSTADVTMAVGVASIDAGPTIADVSFFTGRIDFTLDELFPSVVPDAMGDDVFATPFDVFTFDAATFGALPPTVLSIIYQGDLPRRMVYTYVQGGVEFDSFTPGLEADPDTTLVSSFEIVEGSFSARVEWGTVRGDPIRPIPLPATAPLAAVAFLLLVLTRKRRR